MVCLGGAFASWIRGAGLTVFWGAASLAYRASRFARDPLTRSRSVSPVHWGPIFTGVLGVEFGA